MVRSNLFELPLLKLGGENPVGVNAKSSPKPASERARSIVETAMMPNARLRMGTRVPRFAGQSAGGSWIPKRLRSKEERELEDAPVIDLFANAFKILHDAGVPLP